MNQQGRAFSTASIIFTAGVGSTKGFVQLGHDIEAIIGSAYPGFGFGGRNSVGLLLVNFGF
jgi:hypothetical protein